MERKLGFDTLAVHAGNEQSLQSGSAAPAIHMTTAYKFKDYEYAKGLFELKESGHIYSRLSNPTQDALETKIAALDGGIGALATASGHSAMVIAITNIAKSGDEVVSSNQIYGGAINLFGKTLKQFGITVRFVNPDDPENFRKATNEKTKLYFTETVGNPNANVADVPAIAKIAHEEGVPLIADGTFVTPYLQKPIELGADIVVHSATKFLGGHGTAMAGVIVDSGNFNWDNGKFKDLVDPDPSYHGISYYKDCGKAAYITKARAHLLRDLGPAISPFNAFSIIQGMETLSLRMKRHCENAMAVAEFLEKHDKIKKVNYPMLPSSKYYELAKEILPKGAGSVFTIELDGDRENSRKFIENLQIFLHVANVGDVRSIVTHPATTTHSQLTDEELKAASITPTTVRLSIGLEETEDILWDLENSLKKSF